MQQLQVLAYGVAIFKLHMWLKLTGSFNIYDIFPLKNLQLFFQMKFMWKEKKKHHVHAAAPDCESKKTLARPISFSLYRLAKNMSVLLLLLYLPAVDRSRLQCVSVILIWLVLVLTDLWELFVDLLYD